MRVSACARKGRGAHVFSVRFYLDAVGRVQGEVAREIVDVQRVVGPVHGKSVTIML